MPNGPNKTVAAARRKMGGFPPRPPRPLDPFIEWVAEQARAGTTFRDEAEARAAMREAKAAEIRSRAAASAAVLKDNPQIGILRRDGWPVYYVNSPVYAEADSPEDLIELIKEN